MLHSLTSSFLWSSFFWFKELKLPQSLCSDNKSCSLCPFQSLSVLDDSNPSSPASDFSGLVVEPNLSGRSHTLTFSSSEVSADQTWRSHRRSFACISCHKQAVWKVKYCLVPPALHSCRSCVVVIFSVKHACVCWWCFHVADHSSVCFAWPRGLNACLMLCEITFTPTSVHRNHPIFIHVFYCNQKVGALNKMMPVSRTMRFTWLICVCIRCWMRRLVLEGRSITGRTVLSLIGRPSRCVIGWWVWTWISTHQSSAHRPSMDRSSSTWTVTDWRWVGCALMDVFGRELFLIWHKLALE